MRPGFHASLVNDPFGDPGLYVEFSLERRALLFDLGDIQHLSPRKLLRLSDIFVSHAHMDHFVGLDRLVRICLARPMIVRLYGPAEFLDRVEHRLGGYTWNLVHDFADEFILVAAELNGNSASIAEFHAREAFRRSRERIVTLPDGVVLDEPGFRVKTVALDHRVPSLAYALEESRHVNVLKARVEELGLAVGPWLKELKEAILTDAPDENLLDALDETHHTTRRRLGELRSAVQVVQGRKIAYVADCAGHEANGERIVMLARNADVLYIEASFLEEDRATADRKFHLTAQRAGELARLAHVRRVIPFHFSSRYTGYQESIVEEVRSSFNGREQRSKHEERGI
jgi:ribonuclease Z